MRKYSILVLAVALFFAMGMMAQTSSGSSSTSSQYPSSSDQTTTQSGSQSGTSGDTNHQPGMGTASQTTPGSSQSDTSGTYGSAQTSSTMGSSSKKGKEKTVEGCVVRQQTDYFIFPKSGQPMHISSTGQDVSAHLGHHVKLHGTEQPSSARSAYGSTSGGASGTAVSNSSGATGSSSGSTGNVGANTAGMTGNASTASGSVNEADTGAANNKEIVVDRVDMVSESCPANIQKNIQASGMSTTPQ